MRDAVRERDREALTYNGDHPHHEVGEEREPDQGQDKGHDDPLSPPRAATVGHRQVQEDLDGDRHHKYTASYNTGRHLKHRMGLLR